MSALGNKLNINIKYGQTKKKQHVQGLKVKNVNVEKHLDYFLKTTASIQIKCLYYLLITLPLFFMPFEPCITMWILELVPAPRMFPVTIWTLYTIPGGYSYMSGYQRICQRVAMVHSTLTPWGAEQEPDLNSDSQTRELMITLRASGKLDRELSFLYWIKQKWYVPWQQKCYCLTILEALIFLTRQADNYSRMRQIVWRKQSRVHFHLCQNCIMWHECVRKFSRLIKKFLTCGLAASHQNISLDLPVILINGKPTTDWKFIHDFVSHIIHNNLYDKGKKQEYQIVITANMWWRSVIKTDNVPLEHFENFLTFTLL